MIMLVVIVIILVVNFTVTPAYSQPPVFRSSVEAIPRAFPFKVVFESNSKELAVKGFQFTKDIKGRDVYYSGIQILVKIGEEISGNVEYRVSVRITDVDGNVWEYLSGPLSMEKGKTVDVVYIDFDCSGVTCLAPDKVLEVRIAVNFIGSLVLQNG